MAYFNREQSIVGRNELQKPYTFDHEQLGYRPTYPEEDEKRVTAARAKSDEGAENAAGAKAAQAGEEARESYQAGA